MAMLLRTRLRHVCRCSRSSRGRARHQPCPSLGDLVLRRARHPLRLPHRLPLWRWRAHVLGSASIGLQNNREALVLPKVRRDVNVVLVVHGRTDVEARQAFVEKGVVANGKSLAWGDCPHRVGAGWWVRRS